MVYNVHYCLDQILLSSASESKSCDVCGTDEKKDCCTSEVKILKTDVAQKADITFINDAPLIAIFPETYYSQFILLAVDRNQYSVQVNAPPDKKELPLFISHCNFRI